MKPSVYRSFTPTRHLGSRRSNADVTERDREAATEKSSLAGGASQPGRGGDGY